MGFDLIGHGGFSVNRSGWERLLKLAEQCGWAPAGTVEMDYMEPFDDIPVGGRMGYFSNDGQLVTPEDATAIAAALRRALGTKESISAAKQDEEDTARWWLLVEEFADYCSRGGFRIY
jgi:hypothetical protein